MRVSRPLFGPSTSCEGCCMCCLGMGCRPSLAEMIPGAWTVGDRRPDNPVATDADSRVLVCLNSGLMWLVF